MRKRFSKKGSKRWSGLIFLPVPKCFAQGVRLSTLMSDASSVPNRTNILGTDPFLADTDGEITVLEPGRSLRVLEENTMPGPVYRAPVAWGDLLLVLTTSQLVAIEASGGSSEP